MARIGAANVPSCADRIRALLGRLANPLFHRALNPLSRGAFLAHATLGGFTMDRRSFLTAMLSIAGAAALANTVRPIDAVAGVPGARSGILDELEAPDTETFDDEKGNQAEVEQVHYRRYHRRYYRRHYRRYYRRRGWATVCRSYWRHGRRHVRCYRRHMYRY